MASKKIKMVQCVALHDLSYTDHKGEPQYVRQGSRVIDMDEENFKFFQERKAVRLHETAPVDEFEEDEEEEEEEEDDFADDKGDGTDGASGDQKSSTEQKPAGEQKPAEQKATLSLNKDKSK